MSAVGDAAGALARFEAGAGRAIVIPSGPDPESAHGDGLQKFQEALCRVLETGDAVWPGPATPAALAASASSSTMAEQLAGFFQAIWGEAKQRPELVIAEGAVMWYEAHLKLLTSTDQLSAYYESLGMTYSNYVHDYFKGYLDLLMMAFNAEAELAGCALAIDLQATDIIRRGTKDLDFDKLLTQLTGDCAVMVELVTALGEIYAWFKVLDDKPALVFDAVMAMLRNAYRVITETLQAATFRAWFQKNVDDPVALGQVEGTILGIVICDVIIDELLFMSAGKFIRGMRWLVVP